MYTWDGVGWVLEEYLVGASMGMSGKWRGEREEGGREERHRKSRENRERIEREGRERMRERDENIERVGRE